MLEIVDVQKSFVNGDGQKKDVLSGVDLKVLPGEFFSLLGPSGCGKTTLLRIIAGLETPTSGQILFKGQDVTSWTPQRRPFNIVFQKYALFPHLDVFENVAFGLRVRRLESSYIQKKVSEVLRLVNLQGFESRLPETLSGGQAQRVALARALANDPEVLLLDEPLSALDHNLREQMRTELKLLQEKLGLTFIFVTHDQEEALALSDRIAIMDRGLVEEVNSPEFLYEKPQSLFSSSFLGGRASLKGRLRANTQGLSKFELASGVSLDVASASINSIEDHPAQLFINLDKIQVFANPLAAGNALPVMIQKKLFKGAFFELALVTDCGQSLKALVSKDHAAIRAETSHVYLSFQPQDCFVFADQ